MTIIDLILINLITVYIIDQSGAVDSFKSGLKSLLTKGKMKDPDYSLKPFDCSLCMTFWLSIIYLIVTNHISIVYFALACLNSYMSQYANDLFIVFKHFWSKMMDKILK